MYSTQLLDHFEHPRNAGEVPAANARVRVENPACGDVLELTAAIDGGRIAQLRFRAKGCVPAMACASAMTELAANQPLSEARKISRDGVIDAVGGVPSASGHAAQLAVDALHALLDAAK